MGFSQKIQEAEACLTSVSATETFEKILPEGDAMVSIIDSPSQTKGYVILSRECQSDLFHQVQEYE